MSLLCADLSGKAGRRKCSPDNLVGVCFCCGVIKSVYRDPVARTQKVRLAPL